MRFLSTLLLLSLLGACATIPAKHPNLENGHKRWVQRQQRLKALTQWQIHGRIALFVNNDVYNLGLDWQRHGDRSSIKLEAALGQGMLRLTRNAGRAVLKTSDGKRYTGQNAEQVLRQATGWILPVEGLRAWIKGINHAGSDYQPDIDDHGLARSIRQDGWRINLFDYASINLKDFGTTELPQKLYLKRDHLALKIVIDQWQHTATPASDPQFPNFPL